MARRAILVATALALSVLLMASMPVGAMAAASHHHNKNSGSTPPVSGGGKHKHSGNSGLTPPPDGKVHTLNQKQAQALAKQLNLKNASSVRGAGLVRAPMHRKPKTGQAKAGQVQPQDTVYGDCGESYFYMFDEGQGGYAEFDYGFDLDYLGLTYDSSVYYTNEGLGYSYGYPGPSGLLLGYSASQDDTDVDTGIGFVEGGANFDVELVDGDTCVDEGPTDAANIT